MYFIHIPPCQREWTDSSGYISFKYSSICVYLCQFRNSANLGLVWDSVSEWILVLSKLCKFIRAGVQPSDSLELRQLIGVIVDVSDLDTSRCLWPSTQHGGFFGWRWGGGVVCLAPHCQLIYHQLYWFQRTYSICRLLLCCLSDTIYR